MFKQFDSNTSNKMAEIVAEAYKIPAITSKRSVAKNILGDANIPDDVSVIYNKMNLNILLRRAAEFYSSSVKEPSQSNQKEAAELKTKVAKLSALVDRLNKMCTSNDVREIMADELSAKNTELDEARKRLGVITMSTVIPANDEKLAGIKAAFKILSGYWTNNTKATTLYNLICEKVTGSVKVQTVDYKPVVLDKPEENSEWQKVSYKKKPETYEPSVDIEALVAKHEAGQYIPVQYRKAVEDAIKKKKDDAIKNANSFPTLGEIKKASPKSTMRFKDAIVNKEVPETITVPVDEQPKLVLIEKKETEPKLLSRIVRSMVNVSTYEYPDGKKQTVISPNQNFWAAKQRHRDYMQYLRDKRTKFWIEGMTFQEWLDFRDEVDEMEWQEEEERKQEFLNWYNPPKEVYQTNNENFDDDELYVDYNQEFPNKEYTVTC